MKQYKNVWVVLLIAALLALAAGVSERLSPVISKGNYLTRNKNGEGSYEEELALTVEGVFDSYHYPVKVPEQLLTKEEEQQYLTEAWNEIQLEFPGENEGLESIRKKVEIRDTYQKGRVKAEWNFDNYKRMDYEGNVIGEEIPKQGELVGVTVELSCGSSAMLKEFFFQVFPPELTEQEQILVFVGENLSKQMQERGTNELKLPERMGKYELIWSESKTHLPIKIFLLGAMVAVMMPQIEKSRQREAFKKREQELEIEYPDVVQKLSILLSAGMTLQRAWRKIALTYEQKRKKNEVREMPAYEEMVIVCHELESGRGEELAYEKFGERCGQANYRKLGNLLAQNLRKGNRGMIELLEKEAEKSFEERKQAAKRYGEEAATKLLFPMLLMLGMILLILIVPAVAAFQM